MELLTKKLCIHITRNSVIIHKEPNVIGLIRFWRKIWLLKMKDTEETRKLLLSKVGASRRPGRCRLTWLSYVTGKLAEIGMNFCWAGKGDLEKIS